MLTNIYIIARKKRSHLTSDNRNESERAEQEKQKHEDKLVDLALKWNYLDGILPILQARQNDFINKEHLTSKKDLIQVCNKQRVNKRTSSS